MTVQERSTFEKAALQENFPQLIVSWRNIRGEMEKGPFHLLWQLIETYKVDICNVSLQQITVDFLAFLEKVQELRLELASSFVLMAARMLFYKSRALLPDPDQWFDQEEDRLPAQLVQQLLEYRRFQMAAERLRDLEDTASGLYSSSKSAMQTGEEWFELTPVDLLAAYLSVIEQLDEEAENDPLVIFSEKDSVQEKIFYIEQRLQKENSFTFTTLMREQEGRGRGAVITLFLALLELSHQKIIVLRQKIGFNEIHILKKSTLVK